MRSGRRFELLEQSGQTAPAEAAEWRQRIEAWARFLLSPFVLKLTATTFCGFAIYMLWDRGVGALGGAAVCFIAGGAAFSTALAQRRRARQHRAGAKHAF